MQKIAVDAMGGDNAPKAVVEGCIEALAANADISISLCGPTSQLQELLQGQEYDEKRLRIVEAPDVITNHESPTLAIRRKTASSLVVAMDLVKNGEAEAVVSAGSTGAILAGGIFRIGRIKGIDRPALAPVLPTAKENTSVLLIDSGANMDCKPEYLRQFAIMGSAYMKGVMGVSSPKVGLLNVGAEDEKGNELVKAVYPLLQEAPVDFYGNVEARDALSGEVNVIVADGFAGNVFLKATEGAVLFLFGQLKKALSKGIRAKLGAGLLHKRLRGMKHRLDYQESGGAVLLGCEGTVVKAHGSCKSHAFAVTILQAAACVQADINGAIKKLLA